MIHYEPEIIDIEDLEGRTALHLACSENNINLVNLITSNDHCNIDKGDSFKRTALHWAAVSGHHQIISILLECGANDAIQDVSGATALHYACSKNHSQCVATFLLRANYSYFPDKEGRYPLMWAVSKGHVQTVRSLLEKGVDTGAVDLQGSTGMNQLLYQSKNI